MNKELEAKSTKILVWFRKSTFVCALYTGLIMQKIGEIVRKISTLTFLSNVRFCLPEIGSAYFNISKNSFGYFIKTLNV